jgi:coenzyme F420-0:L-glutamate ligase/coenzyme F420-1:gamma-L-glutamate ligase
LSVRPVTGLREIHRGGDLARIISRHTALLEGDVVVVTQKIVSKVEGRVVRLDPDDPEDRERLIESEAVRVLRRRGSLLLTQTKHGFVCANSGVDVSNVELGCASLLPEDPDRSARRIRDGLRAITGVEVGVVISDTFGRPWRRGVVNVAIGCAGIRSILDLRGSPDSFGRELVSTEICVADEIASAAELVMGKTAQIPVAVVRGLDRTWLRAGSISSDVVRPPSEDLFR